MKVHGNIKDLLISLRATRVLSGPITFMLLQAVRPKPTVWLESKHGYSKPHRRSTGSSRGPTIWLHVLVNILISELLRKNIEKN